MPDNKSREGNRVADWTRAAAMLAAVGIAAAPLAAHAQDAAKGDTVRGVTVESRAQQNLRTDIDRRSYDISKDLQAQTGSISDALRNVPSVDVDVQGNVSLRGDANVTIMVDGKPSSLFNGPARAQILQQLPANGFERVEVMTNPSAAHRPDGTAGIINLVSRKGRQPGRAGSVRASASSSEGRQLGVNLSSVGRSFTATADLSWFSEQQRVEGEDRRSRFDPVSGRFLDSVQDAFRRQDLEVVFGRAAFDWDPTSKLRVSGELRGTMLSVEASDETGFAGLAPGGAVPIGFDRLGSDQIDRDNLAATASLRRKFGADPEHELVLDLTQERTADGRLRSQRLATFGPGLSSRAEQIQGKGQTDLTRAKADYTRPFASGARLKAGYELQLDRTRLDNFGQVGPLDGGLAPEPGLIDRFRFRQAVNGAYVTYQQPVAGLTVLGGLRVEDTRIDLRDPLTGFVGSNDQTRLHPSLHLTWKISDTDQLTGSYSQRIQRPQPADYNPFRLYRDPFSFQAGNPDLKPQLTHAYELAYQRRKGFTYYLATLYYRQNQKGVTDVVTDLGGGVLLTTKQNLARSRSTGLELVANGRLGSKLSYNASGNASWNEIEAGQLGFEDRSAWMLSGRGSLTWQVTPKDMIQVGGHLVGERLVPQGHREPMGMLFAGYRHQFNKDWSVYVSGRDLLGSYKEVLVLDTPQLRARSETHVKLRAVFVGVTYSFGSGAGRRDSGIDYGGAGGGAAQ